MSETINSHPHVFDNQKRTWDKVEEVIAGKTKARVVLLAEPQVGKTGVMIWGGIQRAKKAIAEGVPYLNIIAISDANNALKMQTQADVLHALRCEGMLKERNRFLVEHRSNLNNEAAVMFPKTGMLTVFTDECHIAAAQDAQRDKFQRQVYDYAGGDRLLVDVGATSFAHLALHTQRSDSPYDDIVTLEPGPTYNSIDHMYEMGRIQQVERLVDKQGRYTDFLAERIDTLKAHGGITLIRAIGKRHIAVVRAIRAITQEVPIVEADMFEASPYGNQHITIDEIPEFLSKKPDRPTVLLVRGALRVGIVLKPSSSPNICEMVDTNSLRADTTAQAFLGRSCGYGKRGDTYVIYTNLKDLETVRDFYKDVGGAIPCGLKNTGARKTGTYQVVPMSEVVAATQGPKPVHISRCSMNNEHDVANHVWRGINTWRGRFVWLDSPNPKFPASWARLGVKHPELIGKYVAFNFEMRGYTGGEVNEKFIDLAYIEGDEDGEEAEA